ncbi:hypothetical protein [Nocardia callitridis]|uniref:Uncharacterized protein n=1 Tax=Nocardia callitridis TaxID=648753 RepID=A0ABP9JRA7_9NOCA
MNNEAPQSIAEWMWWCEDHFLTTADYSRLLDQALAENAISPIDRVVFARRTPIEGVAAVRACLALGPQRRIRAAAMAPTDDGVKGYLHNQVDGHWSILAQDGFAYSAEEFSDIMLESTKPDSLDIPTVEVEALSVVDTETGATERHTAEFDSGTADSRGQKS